VESLRVLGRRISIRCDAKRGCAGCGHSIWVCSSKNERILFILRVLCRLDFFLITWLAISLFVDIKHSNADGVVELDNGSLLFVEPHQTKENFVDFLHYVQQDSAASVPSPPEIRNVKYAQTRTSLPAEPSSDLDNR
jgi:hypothetical protein